MTTLTIDRFKEYFEALHGHPPYPWQRRLAERAVDGDWPHAIDLPTGSGKTACIDIAVFALACQAGRPSGARAAPRRVFFCVNRRVIVDEAYQRARGIAAKLRQADGHRGVLAAVAVALRAVAGTQASGSVPPLDVLELRGGIYRDNRWARSATQPTIVCTTIDQLGSRLLFRGYGVSPNAAPIQAALIAYDSLVLLDEAHISEPFRQTLAAVGRYLDPGRWAEQPVGARPMILVPMTATPPQGTGNLIQLEDDDRRNEWLTRRLTADKPADLRPVRNVAREAADAAVELAREQPTAVGVIVNRVATARAIYDQLRQAHPDVIVELVIGSMRPIDRDEQASRLRDLVGPDRPKVTTKTCFVIATQCLEVGADYDFDALVTECASLDALCQRFGRLNRGGRTIDARAAVLMFADAMKPKEPDRIYGDALPATWRWLWDHAQRVSTTQNGAGAVAKGKKAKSGAHPVESRSINFGIDAFKELLSANGGPGRIPKELLAPSALLDAPVMLPAYVDFWCQTAPHPVPDPDVSLFIHGPQRGEPDVQVCWRADLVGDDDMNRRSWCDVVALLPPTSAECMSVPISRLQRWLAAQADQVTDHGDLLGVAEEGSKDDDKNRRDRGGGGSRLQHPGVLWRGVKESSLIQSPGDVRPGDTLVLPLSAKGWEELGHLPANVLETMPDRAEAAFCAARNRVALRVHASLRSSWPEGASIDMLFSRLTDPVDRPTLVELAALLRAAASDIERGNDSKEPGAQDSPILATHLRQLAKASNLLREEYPQGRGTVLMSRKPIDQNMNDAMPVLDDGDDQFSRVEREEPVRLTDHTAHVMSAVDRTVSLLATQAVAEALHLAAKLHDLGKADERFQAMLRRADRTDAWLMFGGTPEFLAKSAGMPKSRSEREAARLRASLPAGFRHEMLSVQLAERSRRLPDDATERDLILHLVAAHHGHARPFAPVVSDQDLADPPPDVCVEGTTMTTADRLASPPHRLDSGIAERFWSLTRRHGWWGLAYLEAIIRLSDQQASAAEDAGTEGKEAPRLAEAST